MLSWHRKQIQVFQEAFFPCQMDDDDDDDARNINAENALHVMEENKKVNLKTIVNNAIYCIYFPASHETRNTKKKIYSTFYNAK